MIRGDEVVRVVRIDEEESRCCGNAATADIRKLTADFEDVDRKRTTRLGVDTSVDPVNREDETEIEQTARDVRTAWIDVDGQ